MKVTILGCSGSLSSPTNPCSGYLISTDDQPSVIMDLGPGTLGRLQTHQNPSDAHVIFSHLHADHCLDFPSLLVWRRFHPTDKAAEVNGLRAPGYAPEHLGLLSSDNPGVPDDLTDTFSFAAWADREPQVLSGLNITPFAVEHPVETYGLRVEDPATGKIIAYSADTGLCDNVVDLARDVDVFFCEAGWGPSANHFAPAMHLSGPEAGRYAREAGAKKLVLVHIPPWASAEGTLAAAKEEFDNVELGYPGMVVEP